MLILRQGKSCELSLIFLEVMDELRMRQPNYHARVHGNAPETYLNKIFDILSRGSNSPALYNDDVIVPTMVRNGYSPDDAQDYTGVGCVEPVCQGKSFASTDAAYHPTPFTSMLLDGCLQKGICSTAGGATYNFSGIQAVGPVDTGDALYAIKQAVFEEKRLSLPGLIRLLKDNLTDGKWRVYLCGLAKFGNDNEEVDAYTMYVINTFQDCLNGRTNTRGGAYTTGLYSVTAHQYFGQVTGALPSGRRRGETFASGISPSNGQDRKGPTAMLNSVNRMDATTQMLTPTCWYGFPDIQPISMISPRR